MTLLDCAIGDLDFEEGAVDNLKVLVLNSMS